MKRILFACAVLAGCMPATEPTPGDDPELPFIRPYRDEGDQCMFTGESSVTVDYLDDAADLVVCPTDYEGRGVFVTETGAIEVGTYRTYTIYSVPIR
ncbi:hypothetical protein [Roseovarius sp. 2305UL8-3]|uniref:hypothetical protein n=1 Tax=Roseovarius conchicola TaxID=3121636 RepID=UPI0035272DD5